MVLPFENRKSGFQNTFLFIVFSGLIAFVMSPTPRSQHTLSQCSCEH